MKESKEAQKTTIGAIDPEVLAFTTGNDPELDKALIEADCIGTAAHVTMLAGVQTKPKIMTQSDRKRVISELITIICLARRGKFRITLADQDVHLAVERVLTERLGDLGKKVHTARSRNDQATVDLRLYAKGEILSAVEEVTTLAKILLKTGRKHATLPMVGRTHMQPAMPSSVGLWAAAFAESLLDDAVLLVNAYELNDRCPLGSAAGYGVPIAIDPALTSRLLGFRRPYDTVLYANNARGKLESITLNAMGQAMSSLARLAQDLMLYTMPEFGYFSLPPEYCTGSSIMPQKVNPDVLELIRAKAARVMACAQAAAEITRSLPSGYNRDLQETKGPFMEGIALTRASLPIMARMISDLRVHKKALLKAFRPAVFATDRALELVVKGMPFRDAYQDVKDHLEDLRQIDPKAAVAQKTHLGAPAGLNLDAMAKRASTFVQFASSRRRRYYTAISKLLDVKYPDGF
ncbi:MAG: argininosuccinate lyase [Kiritimatiellae bacterium]|nr:argininosuccinate lyase [Kiritimatiellia bacterium]